MSALEAKLARIDLVGFDVDGVFTDGRFYLADSGVESKAFHTQDGYGVRQLLRAGIVVAVISGRPSAAVQTRMKELGVQHVYVGTADKVQAFEELLQQRGISAAHSAFVGDDVPDLPVMRAAGLAIAVANAHDDVKREADWTTTRCGGDAAVREVCDAILNARRGAKN